MGNKKTNEDRFKTILAEQLGLDESEIKLTDNIAFDLGADSLDVVEIVMATEEEFEVTIDDDDVTTVKTVADALKVIENAPAW
jgi:acyl carrier protein